MNPILLLLLDSRAPAGAHSHSAGMEIAVSTGMVTSLAEVEQFCRARLATVGAMAAAFAAAAFRLNAEPAAADGLAVLDAELDARTPSPAMRSASRQLGGGLRRLLHALLPEENLNTLFRQCGSPAPHHPVVLGTGVAAAGGTPRLAALAAATATCTTPASAAIRLLGLDPLATQTTLARLAPDIDACASAAERAPADPALLPAGGSPALELLAEVHLSAEVRLFAS